MNTMSDYHNLYLKTDVLLLTDVFEKFTKTCLEYYKLDPCHYFTNPGLSWDSMIRASKVELDLISDTDRHLFIEKGMRVGLSYIAKRHSSINESNKEKRNIIYWDSNNLYGWSMNQPLPYGECNWLSGKEINKLDLDSVSENSSIGYFLEVDLEYPSKIHDFQNDYPLPSENLELVQICCQNFVLILLINME